jgi:hypothetical protein
MKIYTPSDFGHLCIAMLPAVELFFLANKGMTKCHTNEFVQSQFSDGVLFFILRYINIKWPLTEAVCVTETPVRVGRLQY